MLAAIGVYGVMSYSVRRRTRELGTRLALGASPRDITRLVLRQAGVLAIVGLTAGTAATLVLARTLSSLLFGVPPWDPVTWRQPALCSRWPRWRRAICPRAARRVWTQSPSWRRSSDRPVRGVLVLSVYPFP